MAGKLSTHNHSREILGFKYIYPVISRRAGGLSIGVNFNPNNACNWRCIYCQVPDLRRGSAPAIDLQLLAKELRAFLVDVLEGDFFERYQVPLEQRVIKDIAISGNGEPTSLKQFEQAVSLIGEVATTAGVFPASKFVLISNGSLIDRADVQNGLARLAEYDGELWFKLDSATPQGRKLINNAVYSQKKLLRHLQMATALCRTKLQTCVFEYQDFVWSDSEQQAYLQCLSGLRQSGVSLAGVMLYAIARDSQQPEVELLVKMDATKIDRLAADIKALGYEVGVSY